MPDIQEFHRGANDPLGSGRNFEGLASQGRGSSGVSANGSLVAGSPPRLSIRASLVERDRPDEYLEFHFNPSSYRISRSAKWVTTAVDGGTETIEFKGTELAVVMFEMLLNDIAPPSDIPIQRSTEDSLQWLHSRLSSRSDAEISRPGGDRRRRVPWLNVQDLEARNRPPIMVLFGLSQPFICVLNNADATTVFQGVNSFDTITPDGRFVARGVRASNFITRANVSIKLTEYVEAPAAGGED